MILHIMTVEKFIPSFIEFITNNFCLDGHKFAFITSEKYLYGLEKKHNPEFLHTDEDFSLLNEYMDKSKKIVLHGLWRDKVDTLLVSRPALMDKCYWILWGADFYFPEKQTRNRHFVIQHIKHLVTANKRDVEYVRKEYAARGLHVNSICYLSNVFYDYPVEEHKSENINILVGNSAGETNGHSAIFNKLKLMDLMNVRIFSPLSYGNKEYASKIKKLGKEIFAGKFSALETYMPFEKYVTFLSTIDIAIFNAPRQQSFGNILYLLGLGKKVFINNKSNLIQYFSDFDIGVFDIEELNTRPLCESEKRRNMKNIRQHFTEVSLKRSLSRWIL